MRTVDVTFQNLDSSEISLTDVSHYFDSDPTKLVAGLRNDGRTPSSFIADTTTANAQARPCLPLLLSVTCWHLKGSGTSFCASLFDGLLHVMWRLDAWMATACCHPSVPPLLHEEQGWVDSMQAAED